MRSGCLSVCVERWVITRRLQGGSAVMYILSLGRQLLCMQCNWNKNGLEGAVLACALLGARQWIFAYIHSARICLCFSENAYLDVTVAFSGLIQFSPEI